MTEKTTGYALLGTGVMVIVLAAVSVYLVFTKAVQPVMFIKPGPMIMNLKIPSDQGIPLDVPIDMSQMMPIAPLTNIFVHLILMGFLASIGSKLAMIGVNLLRPIVIKAKSE